MFDSEMYIGSFLSANINTNGNMFEKNKLSSLYWEI